MHFSKDLLIIDIEASGLDVAKHEMIQLAAVLLDKKTLKEKASFNAYIKPRRWKNRQPEAMAVNGIRYEQLAHAPSHVEVLSAFSKKFKPQTVILANYGGILDITFLRTAYAQAKLPYAFDYHIFNIWPLCYTYMAKYGKFLNKKKFPQFGLEDFIKLFKLPTQTHDALDDCRVEAEILRRILKKF